MSQIQVLVRVYMGGCQHEGPFSNALNLRGTLAWGDPRKEYNPP